MATPTTDNADSFQIGEAFPGATGKIRNQNADVFQVGESFRYLTPTTTVTTATPLRTLMGVGL